MAHQSGRMGLSRNRRFSQNGFTLIELITVMAIGAIVTAVVTTNKIVSETEETLAHGAGEYLMMLREGMSTYQMVNFLELQNGDPVAGVADPLAPTIPELKALNLINAGAPEKGPMGFVPAMTVTRTNCPGASCLITSTVRTPGSFTSPRTGNTPRYDLAIAATSVMRGTAGISYSGSESTIRGATFSIPNPVAGNPGAVLATVAFLNTSFFNQFVRIQDTRDPDLKGNLSAEGNLSIQGTSSLVGNTTIGGTLVVGGATSINSTLATTGDISSQGGVGSGNNGGCNRAEMLANGQIISRTDCAGTVQASVDANSASMTIRNNGINRVSIEGGATAAVSVRNNAGTIRSRVGDDGIMQTTDAAGVVTAALNGTDGRGTLRSVMLTTDAAAGTACANDGDIVRDAAATGTILICTGGLWRPPGLPTAVEGAVCTNAGQLGQDIANVAYICRGTPVATWVRVNDRVTRSVLMARYLVSDGSTIDKPTCPTGATPAVIVMPSETGADYAGAPPRNRFTAVAIDSGAQWVAFMRLSDGTGAAYANSFGGTPYNFQGLATTYCDFTS